MGSRFTAAAARGWEAVRHNWKPFLLVQTIAFFCVIAYYTIPAVPPALAGVARLKQQGGILLAAATTAFAGAVLPELARLATGRDRTRWPELLFQLAFFGFIGITVDLLYRGLAIWIGGGTDVATVAKKVLFDQLVYSPLVSIPLSTSAFLWKDNGFSLTRTRNAFLAQGGFLVRYAPVMISCWSYWGPVLVAVYAMPSNLQFPLFLLAQAAWSLLLLHLNDR